MNTSTKELNMEELEQACGGSGWDERWEVVEDYLKRPSPVWEPDLPAQPEE